MKKIYLLVSFIIITNVITAQSVGIGISAPKARLHIVGIADTTQLIIDANSIQSNNKPLIRLRNSSGGDLLWIHSDHPSNTFIGNSAGSVNNQSAAGINNTFIGSKAGYSNIDGSNNVAVGSSTLYYNTSGIHNTANGESALALNTVGSDNTAIGSSALFSNTTAGENTAVGRYALNQQSFSNSNTAWNTGNTAVGYYTLYTNNPTTIANGIDNTAVGIYALTANTTGWDNTAIGSAALYSSTIGQENTAIGRQSLFYNTAGYENTATGFKTLRTNTTGRYNTANGHAALFSNTIGDFNTASGFEALYSNTYGYDNTAYGGSALASNITGAFNVGVGYDCNIDLPNSNQNTVMGAGAHISGNNDIAIGYNSFTNVNNLALLGSVTTAQCGGYANWSNFSDGRFKTGVEENVKGLDFILRLRPVTYHMDVRAIYNLWNISPYGKEEDKITASMKTLTDNAIKDKEAIRMSGFIAQEVEKAANDAGYDFDGVIKPAHDKDHYRLAYGEFVVPLVKAMQEQQLIIDSLRMQVEAVKAEIPVQIGKQQKMIEDLKKEIEELKKIITAREKSQQKEN